MRITKLAQEFHVLPYAGGLLDQPGRILMRMEQILDAQQEKEKADRAREEAKERLQEQVSKSGLTS